MVPCHIDPQCRAGFLSTSLLDVFGSGYDLINRTEITQTKLVDDSLSVLNYSHLKTIQQLLS